MTKKTEYVSKQYLKRTLDGAFQKFEERLWPKMLSTFPLRTDLDELKERLVRLEAKFDAGFSNLDTYLKRSELWHDEHVLLRASHQRLKDALVRKGIVSDSEVAV